MTKLKAETGEIRSLHQLNASLNESRRRALFRLEYGVGSKKESERFSVHGQWSERVVVTEHRIGFHDVITGNQSFLKFGKLKSRKCWYRYRYVGSIWFDGSVASSPSQHHH